MKLAPLSLCLALLPLAGCPAGDGDGDDDLGSGDMAAPDDLRQPDDLRPAFHHASINHILGTGQSLSVGAVGAPALSTTQPYDNLRFNTAVIAGGANLTSLVPLTETNVETMSSGMANLITRMAREEVFVGLPRGEDSHEVLVSVHGVGGTAYVGLKKGTAAYQNGMAQVQAGMKIAAGLHRSYAVRAVTNVHGESDHFNNNLSYDQDLLTWQSDYETDVHALTGQREPIPMLHTQVSSWTMYNSTESAIPGLQLKASLARPDRLLLVGPKYNLAYSDGVHLTNAGYRHMGEYYAKVYRRVVLERHPWSPLRPLRVTRQGAVLTVTFAVPVPPLVLDTTLVSDPGRYGFAFTDDSGAPPEIKAVQLAGPDTVRVTLAREPMGKRQRLRYAFTGVLGAAGGPKTGPRGNLRDSDGTRSRNGDPLYNWCVHFEMDVP